VGGQLAIYGNNALKSLKGLENINSLTYFSIDRCPSLKTLSGLEQITQLAGLSFYKNDSLTDISGLKHLISI
jgi:hypothetical protein